MKAREVIAEYFELEANFGPQGLIEALSQAGFVILPKEPSEKIERIIWERIDPEYFLLRMINGDDSAKEFYREIVSHAEGEKG